MSTHLVFLRLQKARVALLAGGLQGVAPLLHQKVALLHVSKQSVADTSTIRVYLTHSQFLLVLLVNL